MDAEHLSELFVRMVIGDEAAWRAFVLEWRPWLVERARRAARVRNWFWMTDPEDLVQEALGLFASQVRAGKFRFSTEGELKGYLVRSLFFMSTRLRRASRPAAESVAPELLDREARVDDWAAAAWKGSDRHHCLELLAQAVRTMGPARREVIELTLFGWRTGEIATRMGRTTGAVSCLKFHALEELKAALSRSRFVDECGDVMAIEARR